MHHARNSEWNFGDTIEWRSLEAAAPGKNFACAVKDAGEGDENELNRAPFYGVPRFTAAEHQRNGGQTGPEVAKQAAIFPLLLFILSLTKIHYFFSARY